MIKQEVFQTPDAKETIAIIYDTDGSVSVGIARAGKEDIRRNKVTSEKGIRIAIERAKKARVKKESLCTKNYLRAFHGNLVRTENHKPTLVVPDMQV